MNSLTDPNTNTNIDQSIDENKNYLADLVGEGKKFKSPEDLAKGKFISDEYIKTLERGRDELRQDYLRLKEDYESRAKLEELVDQLSKPTQPAPVNTSPPVNEPVQQPAFDPKQIESLVSQKLVEHEKTKRQTENFNLVRSKLEERFGPNYQSTLTSQIQELGITKEFVDDLARNHPQVLFKTLGMDQRQEPFQAPVRSQQSFMPTGEKKRTWAYYQQMRKDNPKLYHDPKTVVQMHNDAIKLGSEFEDGDFNQV